MTLSNRSSRPTIIAVCFAAVFCLAGASASRSAAQDTGANSSSFPDPTTREIRTAERRLIASINDCQDARLRRHLDPGVEFYLAGEGVSRGKGRFVDGITREFCRRWRIELVDDASVVEDIPVFGAIHRGALRFCARDRAGCAGPRMQFLNVWKRVDGQWRVFRHVRWSSSP